MRTFAFACTVAVVMARRKKEEDQPRVVPVPEVNPEIIEPEVKPKSSFNEKL